MKNYRGIRDWSKKLVTVDIFKEDGTFLETKPLRHIERHSPDGFEWGYGGSGPADLALSILADLYDMETANEYYQEFKFQFIASLKRNEWEISEREIADWLEKVRASSINA